MGSTGGRRAVPAPFLTKTHRIVEDRDTDEVISWGKDGISFIVWKPVEFANELLPVHFKHNRFSSFIRQLNTYGFRKVMSDRWEFANDKFRRGEEVLLYEIQRRRRPSDSSSSAAPLAPLPPPTRPVTTSATTDTPDTLSSSYTSPQMSPPVPKLTDLSNENTKLRLEKQTLTMEIARTKKMCEDMLASLSKYVDTKGMNMQLLMKEGAMDSTEDMLKFTVPKAAVEEVKEQSIMLFGTLLKVSAQNRYMKDSKRKREWGDNTRDMCSVSERPMKIAPWMPSSISFQPGSNKAPN